MQKNNWLRYYIPLRWTFATRYINIINIINIISFFLIDGFPSFYVVMVLSQANLETALHWGMAFFVLFCFYECGYIFNEVISVRYEENPTVRIPELYFSKIPRHLENLITVRLVLGVLGSWYLLEKYPANWQLYIILVLGLFIVYSIHNFYRGKSNAITMPLEVTLKYMIPISIFVPRQKLGLGLSAVLLTIVCVRLIEYISKKRFVSWIRVTRDVDTFRVKYYTIAVIMAFGLAYTNIWPWKLCGLPVIFLCYRIASYYMMHHSKKVASVIKNGRKHHKTDDSE